MYALYRQTHRPCGIENSVYCNFVSPIEKTLIVTAASQLTIYKVKDKFKVSFFSRKLYYFYI